LAIWAAVDIAQAEAFVSVWKLIIGIILIIVGAILYRGNLTIS
jgi:hypothetical protein